jgi:hypothetical protein
LRVPPALEEAVAAVSLRDGVSRNAALLHLAELGAVVDARGERRRQARIAARDALNALTVRGAMPADYDPEKAAAEQAAAIAAALTDDG